MGAPQARASTLIPYIAACDNVSLKLKPLRYGQVEGHENMGGVGAEEIRGREIPDGGWTRWDCHAREKRGDGRGRVTSKIRPRG